MQLNIVDPISSIVIAPCVTAASIFFALLARGVSSATNVASWNDAADDLLDDALDSVSSTNMHVNMQEASAMNPHLAMLEGGGALSESLGLPPPLGLAGSSDPTLDAPVLSCLPPTTTTTRMPPTFCLSLNREPAAFAKQQSFVASGNT